MQDKGNKALIVITTCKRLDFIKLVIIPYLQFVNKHRQFDFCIALDGKQSDYLQFCDLYNIPLVYSEEREGVGLSKNRVLKAFPDYNHYFFIEDDVELFDGAVFEDHISKAEELNIQHFSLSYLDFKILNKNKIYKYRQVENVGFSMFGSADFNYFSRLAIQEIGGWHTNFVKYKRYGHTEHSYRLYKKGLNPTPFVFFIKHIHSFIWHDPPHVTKNIIEKNINGLVREEQDMIDADLNYFPVSTISSFYFNNKDLTIETLHPDLSKHRYNLLKGRTRIKAKANLYLHKYKKFKNPFHLLASFCLYPKNNALKHYIKTSLRIWS